MATRGLPVAFCARLGHHLMLCHYRRSVPGYGTPVPGWGRCGSAQARRPVWGVPGGRSVPAPIERLQAFIRRRTRNVTRRRACHVARAT